MIESKKSLIRGVVLAGGFGTRVRHLLSDLPKPMAPCAGRPFVEWVIRFLGRQGVLHAVLSTGYLAEKISAHFSSGSVGGVRVECVHEAVPLGTGGGFLNCVSACLAQGSTDLWLVTNGDSLVIAPLAPLFALFEDASVDAAILGLRVADASRYGTLAVGSDGRLLDFLEKKPGSGVINGGVYVFRHVILETFSSKRPLSFEADVFPEILKVACVKVLTVDAPFLDIGTPETLWEAEAFVKANLNCF